MDTQKMKRIMSIFLCIICLIPSVTCFAAEICPQCGGRMSMGQPKTTCQKYNDDFHYVIVKRTCKCGGRCGMSFDRQISKTKQGHGGVWDLDGRNEKKRCPGCGHVSTRPRSISYIFGDETLEAPMLDSEYVSNMKNAIWSWAQERKRNKEDSYNLEMIVQFDGGLRNFGNLTRDAVKLFQEKNGLENDGRVGPATKNFLLPYSDVLFWD